MKKFLRYIILILIIALSTFFIFRTTTDIHEKKAAQERIQQLPSLNLYDLSGKKINIQDIADQQATVVLYFSPDCKHCQYEVKEFKKNLAEFKKAQILMVTLVNASEAKEFANDYGLNSISNIHFLLDKTGAFYTAFGTHQFPSIFIYNKKHKLVKKFIGETKMDAIVDAINP